MANVKPSPVAGSNEMVERVAIAIFRQYIQGGGGNQMPLDEMTHGTQKMYREAALAAIQAMREAPQRVWGRMAGSAALYEDEARDIWHDMIDEALK